MSEVVLDASALLALLHAEPGAEIVAQAIPEAAISSVNLSEVVAKLIEDGLNPEFVYNRIERYTLEVVPFDTEQAYDSGLLRASTMSLGLSLGDRCCLSLARSLGLPVLTADRAWRRLSVGVEVNLVR